MTGFSFWVAGKRAGRWSAWACLSATILLGQACTVAPILPDKSILVDLNEKTIMTVEQARDAQARMAALKAELAYQDRNAEIACYQRFFVNRCLGDIDMVRKAKEAQLRSIDAIAQSVIRQDRAAQKSDELAKSVESQEARAPKEASDRQDAIAKTQSKTDTQTQKLSDVQGRAEQDAKTAAESNAARLAKLAEIEKKNDQARAARAQEPLNRARYAAKKAAQAARIAESADKQKNAKTRAPVEARKPRPVKP